MLARDWFEYVRMCVLECERLRDRALARDAGGAGGLPGSTSARSAEPDAAMIRATMATLEYERERARVRPMVERSRAVLYGGDGHGGLAAAKGSATAECIDGYYLMGMTWPEVAREMAAPDSDNPRHWCAMRAYRAFDYMDRVGMDTLARFRDKR